VDLKDATGPPTTVASSPTPTTPAPATSNVVQYLANDPAVQYAGAWSPNNGAFNIGSVATLSMTANSSAVLPFTGTGVQWIGFSDPWSGIAQVYLDGVLTATVDTYSAVQVAQKVQYSVSNLANAAHILTIVATGTVDSNSAGEWVWVNAFEVTTPSTAPAPVSTPAPASTPGLGITTTSALPSGTAGASYSQTLAASGGAPPYTWTLASGTLPTGLSLAGGVIAGTPIAAGASTFAIQVADSASAMVSQSVSLTVAQSSISYTSAGSMAQIASGGSWSTTITLVNNGTAPADIQLNFYDDNGAPLTLPLTFPQTSSTTALLAATLDQTIAAGAGLVIVTSGPASLATQEGWAQLLADSSVVSGFAVFAWTGSSSAQAAVSPLQGANAGSWVLWFDNTGGNATGVALANVASAAAAVPVIVRDDIGTILTSNSVALAALAHESFMVSTQYPQTAGKRGTIQFQTPAGGQVGVLGLQASASGALTSVPPLAQ